MRAAIRIIAADGFEKRPTLPLMRKRSLKNLLGYCGSCYEFAAVG
jgi:hypothetical protein